MNLSRRQMLSTLACATIAPGIDVAPQVAPATGVAAWRAQFPALAQKINGHPLAYLDNAATTARPRAVIDALAGFHERDNANPSAAMHTLARRARVCIAADGLALSRS